MPGTAVVRRCQGTHRVGALTESRPSPSVKLTLILIKKRPGTGHAYAVLHNFLFQFFTFTAGEIP
jgi:hypothetical protein